MQKLSIALILFFLLQTTPTVAEMKVFPLWERKQCNSIEMACYTFEQTKKIMNIDLDMQLSLNKLNICNKNLIKLEDAVKKLGVALVESDAALNIAHERIKEKDAAIEELRNHGTNEPSLWDHLPWISGAVGLLVAGAFISGWYIGKD